MLIWVFLLQKRSKYLIQVAWYLVKLLSHGCDSAFIECLVEHFCNENGPHKNALRLSKELAFDMSISHLQFILDIYSDVSIVLFSLLHNQLKHSPYANIRVMAA